VTFGTSEGEKNFWKTLYIYLAAVIARSILPQYHCKLQDYGEGKPIFA
jgi:hypothetical protein